MRELQVTLRRPFGLWIILALSVAASLAVLWGYLQYLRPSPLPEDIARFPTMWNFGLAPFQAVIFVSLPVGAIFMIRGVAAARLVVLAALAAFWGCQLWYWLHTAGVAQGAVDEEHQRLWLRTVLIFQGVLALAMAAIAWYLWRPRLRTFFQTRNWQE